MQPVSVKINNHKNRWKKTFVEWTDRQTQTQTHACDYEISTSREKETQHAQSTTKVNTLCRTQKSLNKITFTRIDTSYTFRPSSIFRAPFCAACKPLLTGLFLQKFERCLEAPQLELRESPYLL